MICIDKGKIELWVMGEDKGALDEAALSHLKGCSNCLRELRMALALRVSAMNSDMHVSRVTFACAHSIDDETRLSYLDDLMNDREKVQFEVHLHQCPACQHSLLEIESEIADLQPGDVVVPDFILAKAKEIGEREISKHLKESWLASFGKELSSLASAMRQPRWAGAMALMVIVVAASLLYVRSLFRVETNQPAHSIQEAPVAEAPNQAGGQALATANKLIDPTTIERVQGVLTQIERVADGLRPNQIRLHIIDSDDYIAQMAPNGELTLSTQYIAATQNDDELAFLLAHEVSHRQHPANCILSFSTSAHQPASVLNSINQKQAELQADRMGVFLASVAGFNSSAAENLFSRIQNIPNISDAAHPEFSTRLKETGDELRFMVRSIELFRVGVSFFNTKQYSRSVAVFEAAAKMFPSRESLNDLGLAYHTLALEYSSQNWGFKKSVILDPVARSIEPTREDLPQADLFAEFLNKAIEQYRKAIERDPDYVAVRINLSSALDDRGDSSAAVHQLDAVVKMETNLQERAKALNNLGVFAAKQSNWESALSLFQQAVKADPMFSDPHFNLARIWELQDKPKAALDEYAAYVRLAGNERDGWLRMAYNKLNKPWETGGAETLENLPSLDHLRLGASLATLTRQLGTPTITWKLKTPTQFEFSVSLFETRGLLVSGSEDVVDFVQTTSRYSNFDPDNHLVAGLSQKKLTSRLRHSTRIKLPGSRESYVDFDRGLGINLRNHRVNGWYIFEPIA